MTHTISSPARPVKTAQAKTLQPKNKVHNNWTNQALAGAMSAGDGRIISFAKGIDMLHRFEGSPRQHAVSAAVLRTFCERCRQLKKHPAFPAHFEMGWRMYLGIDAQEQYQVIIVPVAGPQAANGAPRDYTLDWETDLFAVTETPFFALAPSQNAILEDVLRCRHILGRIDASGIEGVSLLDAHMERFIEGLPADAFAALSFGFARNEENKLTLVAMAQDKRGEPLRSNYKDPRTGLDMSGYWWDDSGMFPPPPPWNYRSYFNRS
jgi:hypothetical protein